MEYVLEFWMNSFKGKGRITRRDFFITWFWVNLINLLLIGITLIINDVGVKLLIDFIVVISRIPMLTMVSRRFHDMNESAWNLLLFCFPFVNIIAFFFLCCCKGRDKDNRYGEPPQEISNENSIKKGIISIIIIIITMISINSIVGNFTGNNFLNVKTLLYDKLYKYNLSKKLDKDIKKETEKKYCAGGVVKYCLDGYNCAGGQIMSCTGGVSMSCPGGDWNAGSRCVHGSTIPHTYKTPCQHGQTTPHTYTNLCVHGLTYPHYKQCEHGYIYPHNYTEQCEHGYTEEHFY